jgi:threonine aldolase
VLAAAGLIAFSGMPHRLGEDHANARFLAAKLAEIPGIQLDPQGVQTNIVIFDIHTSELTVAELSARLKARGALMNGANASQMRAVTHYDISREIHQALAS